MYKAVKVDGKWEQIEALPINSINYSVTCPSLSEDGKTLYFSSNMPGGFGGNDIWKVEVSEGDVYGTPVNLGSKINTEGNEQFPSITDDNLLYFSFSHSMRSSTAAKKPSVFWRCGVNFKKIPVERGN